MNEILIFVITTYLIVGLLQGLYVSFYENWNDGYGAPGESIIGIMMFMFWWPIFWITGYYDCKDDA